MLTSVSAAVRAAATLPLFPTQAAPDKVAALLHAATLLAQLLGQGRALDRSALRAAMEAGFGGSDAEGLWVWKDAYEALEAAQVLFLRKFAFAMRSRAGSGAAMLTMLIRLAERLPSHTRRSEKAERFQQFSTPITLGFVTSEAAALTAADLVLEPSAGTGLLAIFAELAKARLVLNEIADTRAGLLDRLFRDGTPVVRHNAEQIHDRLDPAIRPTVVLMNPPFRVAQYRGTLRRSRDPAHRRRPRASRRRRAARRRHRAQCRSRSAGLARELCSSAGKGPRRLHGGTCRLGLCPPRHHDRDPSHGDRSHPGRRSPRLPAVSRHGRHAGRSARPRRPSGAGARTGCCPSPRIKSGASSPRPCRISRAHGEFSAAESCCTAAQPRIGSGAGSRQTPGANAGRGRARL